MSVNLDNFLHSLAEAIATAATLVYRHGVAGTATKCNLFRHAEDQEFATFPYSVLRLYPGGRPARFVDPPRAAIQVMTKGKAAAALGQAQAIYEALHNSDGTARMGWIISGFVAGTATADGTWKIISIDFLQSPGQIGGDENGNVDVSFNVEVQFCKAT